MLCYCIRSHLWGKNTKQNKTEAYSFSSFSVHKVFGINTAKCALKKKTSSSQYPIYQQWIEKALKNTKPELAKET